MMQNNKIKTLINFSKKAGIVVYGQDNLTHNVALCLTSNELSENSLNKIRAICNRYKINHKVLEQEFFNLNFNDKTKVVALLKSELATSIGKLMEEN